MRDTPSAHDDRESLVDAAIAEYLQGKHSTSFDVDAWLARHPEAAEELAEFLRDEGVFGEWFTPMRAPADSTLSHRANTPTDSTLTVGTPHMGEPFEKPRRGVGFEDFELLDEIARGGMGVVYRARQKSLNRVVALKMVLAGQFASRSEAEQLYREAEAAAGLDHPNIVPVYEVGEHDARPFFAMKLVPGGSLADHAADLVGKPREVAALVATVARAVYHAHQRGILHRDLKPSNILMDGTGEPHVTDFGLARRLGPNASVSGAVAGTPSYMAPEQARGEKGLTTAVDVYGLGGVLYFLLTGVAPFKAESTAEVLLMVLATDPVAPRMLRPDIPRDLETICMKCLAKEPGRRYASAAELADDLGRWLAGEPIAARPAGRVERAVKWTRRNPAIAGLIGTAAVALIAIVVGLAVTNSLVTAALGEKTEALGQAEIKKTEAENALARERVALGEKDAALFAKNNALVERTKAADELTVALKKEKRTAYQRGVMVVERDIKGNRLEAARRLLDSLGPEEHRGWEWAYLRRLSDPSPVCSFPGLPLAVIPIRGAVPGAELVYIRPTENPRKGVVFTSPGLVTSGDAAKAEVVIAREDGTVRWSLPLPGGVNAHVSASPDGRWISVVRGRWPQQIGRAALLGNAVQTVVPSYFVDILDTTDGKTVCTLPIVTYESGPVFPSKPVQVVFHPAGDRVATSYTVNVPTAKGSTTIPEVRLWALPSGKPLRTYPNISGCLFSPNGSLFAAGTRIIETATGKEITSLSVLVHESTTAFRPDGQQLARLDDEGGITVWDTVSWKVVRQFAGQTGRSLAYSPDGKQIAVGREDGTVRVLRAEDASERHVVRTSFGSSASGWVRFHPAGDRVFTARDVFEKSTIINSQSTTLWSVRDTQDVRVITGVGSGFYGPTLCFDPNGKWVASAASNWGIKLWNPVTGEVIRTLTGAKTSVFDVAVSPNGAHLAAATHDGAWLWDLQTEGVGRRIEVPENLQDWKGTDTWFGRVTFSPDSAELALAHPNGIMLCEAKTGKLVRSMANPAGQWNAGLDYSPDGKLLLSTRRDGPVQLWDPKTGKEIDGFEDPELKLVKTARWFADSKRFAVTGSNGVAQIWDTTGEELQKFTGHTGPIQGIAISKDQKRVATAGMDGTVKVWDVESGAELLTLTGHRGEVFAVAFSADGTKLASTGADRTLRIWDATLTPEMRYHGPALERVRALAAEVVLKDEVVQRLRNDASIGDEFRKVALSFAAQLRDNPTKLNEASWKVVARPGASPAEYHLALRQAEAADRLKPNDGSLLNTLGVAQFRAGKDQDAVRTLTRADQLNTKTNKGSHPTDLAPLAMAQHRLGLPEARDTIKRLQMAMQDKRWANDEECLGFLREAQTVAAELFQ